jgi:ABC-type sugar transport system substrate-binding protein
MLATSVALLCSGVAAGPAAAKAATAAAAKCGTVPGLKFTDKSGVIAKLGGQYAAAYNGYPDVTYASAWAHTKAKKGPYTIGLVTAEPLNSFNAGVIADVGKSLQNIPGVKKVITLDSATPAGVTTQIQQVDQLIQEHVSAIVVEPNVSQPFVQLAQKAHQAGIPMISIINAIQSPYAISIDENLVEQSMKIAADVAKLVGGHGVFLGVHGIASTSTDQQSFLGYSTAFARCPNITFNTSIVGDFSPPVAQQALTTYLSQNPQPVAGVLQVAGMGPAVIQAFQQVGRPQPALGDASPTAGDLAYWSQTNGYKAVADALNPKDLGAAVAYTVKHVFSGHGPKISELASNGPLITASNLAKYVVPGADTSSEVSVSGPANLVWPAKYLARLFNG